MAVSIRKWENNTLKNTHAEVTGLLNNHHAVFGLRVLIFTIAQVEHPTFI